MRAETFGHALTCDPAGRPGCLEVETAGDAVDIEEFASEKDAGSNFAFHRLEVHFRERDAAARHEFLFVQTFSGDGQNRVGKRFKKLLLFGTRQRVPTAVRWKGSEVYERLPDALRKRSERRVGHTFGSM